MSKSNSGGTRVNSDLSGLPLPTPPTDENVSPRTHKNAAGVEFVTVECPACRFSHAHPVEREASSPALDVERLDEAMLAKALHGFLMEVPTWPHSEVRPRVDGHRCWPCWNGADYVLARLARPDSDGDAR